MSLAFLSTHYKLENFAISKCGNCSHLRVQIMCCYYLLCVALFNKYKGYIIVSFSNQINPAMSYIRIPGNHIILSLSLVQQQL